MEENKQAELEQREAVGDIIAPAVPELLTEAETSAKVYKAKRRAHQVDEGVIHPMNQVPKEMFEMMGKAHGISPFGEGSAPLPVGNKFLYLTCTENEINDNLKKYENTYMPFVISQQGKKFAQGLTDFGIIFKLIENKEGEKDGQ